MMNRLIASILSCAILAGTSVSAENKTTITIGTGCSKGEMQSLKELTAMYMKKHPDINVVINELPVVTTERYSIYLQNFETKSGDNDIIQIDQVWPGDLAPHLLDLNKYGAGKITGQMFPKMVENDTVNGRLVALPWFADAPALYYRKDLLEKYKIDVPKTWKDLTKAAYLIQTGERQSGNPDFIGFVWQGEAYEGLTCCALEWIYSNGGGTIVSNDKKVTLNNDKAAEAINMALSWIGTISPGGTTSMEEEASRIVFQSGNAAFMRNWQYAYTLSGDEGSKIKGKVGICSMPAGDGNISGNTAGVENLGVNEYSRHPAEAADVALFLVSSEAQKHRALVSGLCPTIKSLYEDKDIISKAPAVSDFLVIFEHGVNRPSTVCAPNYAKVSKIFYTAVNDVLTGKKDAKSALSEAAKAISGITGYPISEK